MRIFFMGMMGLLSRLPLAALIKAGINVVGVGIPETHVPPFLLSGSGSSDAVATIIINFPESNKPFLHSQPTLLQLAGRAGIPAFALGDLSRAATSDQLLKLEHDLICVSCFPHKIPPTFLEVPLWGCLNAHPALLPRFRGPAPIFWTFQQGVQETGVTIHFMDEGLDTGDIALQVTYRLPDGISGLVAEQALGQLAGDCLVKVVEMNVNGALPRYPQVDGPLPDPWPRPVDFTLDPNWPVQRAFNFMRGTAEWGRPYLWPVTNPPCRFSRALKIIPHANTFTPANDESIILFADGFLHVKNAA